MDTAATNELPEGTPDYIAKRRQGRETLLGLLYEAELKQDDLVKIVESSPLDLDGYAQSIFDRLLMDIKRVDEEVSDICLLYTSPSPRDGLLSRMPSSA